MMFRYLLLSSFSLTTHITKISEADEKEGFLVSSHLCLPFRVSFRSVGGCRFCVYAQPQSEFSCTAVGLPKLTLP